MNTMYGYIRVSSLNQEKNFSLESQTNRLLAEGIENQNIISETHTATTLERPKLKQLISLLKPGDQLYVVRLDRFARSTLDALFLIKELEENGIEFYSLDFPRFEDQSMRAFMRVIFLYLAEFENKQRKIRQMEGIQLAKLNGKYLGRQTRLTEENLDRIKRYMKENKLTKIEVARLVGISRTTLYKGLKILKYNQKVKYKEKDLNDTHDA